MCNFIVAYDFYNFNSRYSCILYCTCSYNNASKGLETTQFYYSSGDSNVIDGIQHATSQDTDEMEGIIIQAEILL